MIDEERDSPKQIRIIPSITSNIKDIRGRISAITAETKQTADRIIGSTPQDPSEILAAEVPPTKPSSGAISEMQELAEAVKKCFDVIDKLSGQIKRLNEI